MKQETPRRSVVKSITYRILIVCSDAVIVYFITHRADLAVAVTAISNVASTVFYYLHERAWSGVSWGLKKKKPAATTHS